MMLSDLLRQGRSITDQLNSGDIPLIDAEGKEVNIQLALNQSENKLVCEIALVRRKLDDMTQEEWKELKKQTQHSRYLSIQDGKLGGYFAGDELRRVLNWLDEHNFEY